MKAVELDDDLADAHHSMAGFWTWSEFDWDRAQSEFERAIEINPNDADARIFYGHFLAIVRGRREEARQQIERALELDPLNSFFRGLHAMYLTWYGQYDEAIAQCHTALETLPNYYLARFGLWLAFQKKGMLEDAFREAKSMFESFGDQQMVETLVQGHAAGGYQAAMLGAAETLAVRSSVVFVRPFMLVILYDAAGQADLAFEWLEKAYEARDHDMAYLGVTALSNEFLDDPRRMEMVRRLNLPDQRGALGR